MGLGMACRSFPRIWRIASVAGLLVTTEVMVADKPQKSAPAMPAGGMGGMDGMDF